MERSENRSDRIRRGVRASTGQTAIEYLAMLGIVTAVVGAIVATSIGSGISRSAHRQVCRIVAAVNGGDCPGDNDVIAERKADSDREGDLGGKSGVQGPAEPGTLVRSGGAPVSKSVAGSPAGAPTKAVNALPDLCFEARESSSSVSLSGNSIPGKVAAWGFSTLINFIMEKISNEKNKEKRVKQTLDDLAYCLPNYNIVIAQPHEGNLQEMDGTAMIETVEISGSTYRVYAFKKGKFTWADDADLGWKNRGFRGVYDMSEDKRTITFDEPSHPKRKEGWKPGDEGCEIEGQEPPDRSRYYDTYSPLDNDGSAQAVRMLVNDMRRCYPDYNVVAMHSEQKSHWVDEPDTMVHHGRYRLNSNEFTEDEVGDDIASGRAVFDVYVFDKGKFKNDGDGGYTNWAMYGDLTRDGSEVSFEQPDRADLDADTYPTGSGTSNFNDETPKYTDGGPYPGTDYSGKVPKGADLTHSLIEEYGRSFPGKNIIAAKSFNNLSFTGVSGLEHLAVVNGVDIFAVDGGSVTNKGDGGWKNWGFTGNFEYDEDGKKVTFSNR